MTRFNIGKSMPTLHIIGNIGAGNLGDELMCQALLSVINNYASSCIVYAKRPDLCNIGINQNDMISRKICILRISPIALWKHVGPNDTIIWLGGTFLEDFMIPRRLFRHFLFLLYIYLLLRIASFKKCAIIFCGHGIGPLSTKIGAKISGMILNLADYIAVRDFVSILWIRRRIGRIRAKINLYPDLCFALNLPKRAPKKIRGCAKVLIVPAKDRSVSRRYMFDARKICRSVYAGFQGLGLSCVVHFGLFGTARNENDADTVPPEVPVKSIKTIKDLSSIMSQYDLVIAGRYHAGVLSPFLNIPTVIIPYHPKCRSWLYWIPKSARPVVVSQECFVRNPGFWIMQALQRAEATYKSCVKLQSQAKGYGEFIKIILNKERNG